MKSPDTPIAKKGFFVTHFLTVKADALFNAAVARFGRPRVVEFIGVLGYNSMLGHLHPSVQRGRIKGI